MNKDGDEDLESSTKYWICHDNYIDGDVKVTDLCRVTRKYSGSTDRYCNIKVKLNH